MFENIDWAKVIELVIGLALFLWGLRHRYKAIEAKRRELVADAEAGDMSELVGDLVDVIELVDKGQVHPELAKTEVAIATENTTKGDRLDEVLVAKGYSKKEIGQ